MRKPNRILFVLAFSPALLIACEPASNGAATATNDVVYGDDDRVEAMDSPPAIQHVAESVALAVPSTFLTPVGEDAFKLQTRTVPEVVPDLCAGERFSDQRLTGEGGTAFLVAPDIVATAYHVNWQSAPTDRAYVFGFMYRSGDTLTETFAASDVYRGVELLHVAPSLLGLFASPDDWQLIRLDRPVASREPLKLRRSGAPSTAELLYVVGHPLTLPMKVAPGRLDPSRSTTDPLVFLNADTFQGNSGSPVINATTLEVEGILIAGAEDFKPNVTAELCQSIARRPADGAYEEKAVPARTFADLVPNQ